MLPKDGRIYSVVVAKAVQFQGNDLALLQFCSNEVVYAVATVGDSSSLKVGVMVFVGGFTLKANNPVQRNLTSNSSRQAQRRVSGKFVFTEGEVSLVLNKTLEGGYQIGYTNDIRKGMSGAPLLNHLGEVVGINGLHKDPV